MKKTLIIGTLLMINMGCIRDYKSSTQSYLKNNTNYSIKIIPFKNGVIDNTNIINILPQERKLVYNANVWGRTMEPCYGILNQPYDSLIVQFTDNNKTTRSKHLNWKESTTSCINCIPFENLRNLSNEESYKKVITKEHSKYLVGYWEYTFTEDDYNFAKEP